MQVSHFKNIDFFYTPPELIKDDFLEITGEELTHISKVLRKKIGDVIFATDGKGFIYECKIIEISKTNLSADILSKTESDNEPKPEITLALGLLKNPSKYDFVVEKATELGVKNIIPFTSKFTISEKPKIERWQNLAISAMKQSQRAYLPKVSECIKYEQLIELDFDLKLIAEQTADNIPFQSWINNPSILVAVGPEGGFSDDEINKALQHDFKKFNLSNMRLRAETAAIVSIPLIISRFSL